ncbi:MAG: hypothetical protein H7296_12935 [Bacteroidia bacterium]|nr:hypothetical protein [Bacteroidia bacterium]
MKKKTTTFLAFLISFLVSGQQKPNPVFLENKTYTYNQLIIEYKKLDALSEQMKLFEYGQTDGGFPIHLMVINRNKNFNKPVSSEKGQTVLLIMNGIHPGESEGIDASLFLAQEMAYGRTEIPENVTICIIPVYNVDGMLNRKKYTRTNQNGPEEKGFRGNACNYDLNRDFIKADTRNTFAFYQIYHYWNPDVFLDNHTSNGADYQYTMTLICTQQQKLGGKTAELLHKNMKPFLYADMQKKYWEMAPYVNVYGKSPDEEGYEEFIETPKFSTGYTSLFGTIGFVAETHMLKPYPNRVFATIEFMRTLIDYTKTHVTEIRQARMSDQTIYQTKRTYESNYVVDKSAPSKLKFKGFEAEKIKSSLGNYERTLYNRNKPFTREINYFNFFKPALEVALPKAYIIPQSWIRVIERLKANNITMQRFERDSTITLGVKYITKYESNAKPYEGHHVNSKIGVERKSMPLKILKGDYLVYTNQTGNRYLAEALEPQTEDGFFAWNFFDPILNAKEGFSDYVFEDDAVKLLEENVELRKRFEDWKFANPDKVNSSYEVLNFIFVNSYFYETEHKRVPVYRLE